MKPLFVLIGTFILSIVIIKLATHRIDYQLSGRIAMSSMLLFTAIGHFTFTKGMAAMVPDFLPLKSEIVLITGVIEILFAVGLLVPSYKLLTGWVLIAFFILILPANIKASIEHINYQTGELNGNGLSYLWFRIPLQVIFIIWVYVSVVRQ
ncbi:hypothetical protein FNH22_15835 [Fulvivirga sp. M361]|uniref:DoxX family protein n=1 Tax=Fulvivirga sp. M361 TaxID=2594266 RepID=UPI00117B9828|nr:hypothetical protein [Fulvivirga sp. M361]TRX57608.1 hypothetical protein FNH22_15835 [Fulvivirga sp. M361]